MRLQPTDSAAVGVSAELTGFPTSRTASSAPAHPMPRLTDTREHRCDVHASGDLRRPVEHVRDPQRAWWASLQPGRTRQTNCDVVAGVGAHAEHGTASRRSGAPCTFHRHAEHGRFDGADRSAHRAVVAVAGSRPAPRCGTTPAPLARSPPSTSTARRQSARADRSNRTFVIQTRFPASATAPSRTPSASGAPPRRRRPRISVM